MEPLTIALGFTPYFAGRPLLATFVVAAAYATGAVVFDRQRDMTFGQAVLVIVAFGLLAVLEAIWKRVAAWLREVAESASRWIRRGEAALSGVAAVLVAAFILGAFETAFDRPSAAIPSTPHLLHAGFDATPIGVTLIAVFLFAYAFSSLRAYVLDTLEALVPGELGVTRVLGFAESFWTAAGVLLALVFPLVASLAMVALLIVAAGVVLTLRGISAGERARCTTCEGDVHLCALRCGRCGTARSEVRRHGLLGPARAPAPEAEAHQLTLLARRRCAHCAEPLHGVRLESHCETCRRPAFATENELRAFVRKVDGRVLRWMPIAAVLGLVPGAGWALGLFGFKLGTANALAGYVPWQGRLWTRLVRGALLMIAGLLQLVPFIGAIVVPVTLAAIHLSNRAALMPRAREAVVAQVA